MNIQQAMAVSNLGARPRVRPLTKHSTSRTAVQIAERVFASAEESGRPFGTLTPSEWRRSWLASEKFYLVELPLHLAAVPQRPTEQSRILECMRASADSVEPIVVDLNKQKLGHSSTTSFFPPVIVVEGEYRHAGFRLQGRERIKAWVGELAAQAIGLIQADHQFGASELRSKIQEELSKQYPANPEHPYTSGPYISEVYPLENYFVYSYQGKTYRLGYKCSLKKRSVSLMTDPKEVTQKYVDLHAAIERKAKQIQAATPMERSMRIFAHGGAGAGMGGPGSSLGNGSGAMVMPANMGTNSKPTMSAKKKKMAAQMPRATAGPSMAMKPIPTTGNPTPATSMPHMRSKGKKKARLKTSGYQGYHDASKSQSNRTRGASHSEMAPKLKGSGYFGYHDASDEESQRKTAPKGSEMVDPKVRNRKFNSTDDVGGLKGAAEILADASKVGKIWTDCQKAMKGGWKPKMSAKAPPGWEDSVKKMKDHPGISNPWALAWYMKDEGYHPGGSEKGKK